MTKKKKIKTYAEYKILRYEVKVKTKQTTKIITSIYQKKKKKEARSIKNVGSYSFCCQCGPKM